MRNTYVITIGGPMRDYGPTLLVLRPHNDIVGTLKQYDKAYIFETKQQAEKTRHERRETRNKQQKELLTTNQ